MTWLWEIAANGIPRAKGSCYEDEEPVATQCTKVTRPVSLPITILSLWLAHCPGRYSGGSHKILSEDEVTQSPLIPSLLTDNFGTGSDDSAVVLGNIVDDGIGKT